MAELLSSTRVIQTLAGIKWPCFYFPTIFKCFHVVLLRLIDFFIITQLGKSVIADTTMNNAETTEQTWHGMMILYSTV